MKSNVIIYSDELSTADIQRLLQAIRDCEQRSFPEKEIGIAVFVPDLSFDVVAAVVKGVKPPFKHGPMVFKGGAI